MTDSTATTHLSIGEVLGLLLEEFPDVTISKIRFLESQGLIEPERTPSGYRKFYDGDVELLRIILREQREKFLPLRVIKDRIVSGEIEPPPGATATPPRGIDRRPAAPAAAEAAPPAATGAPPPDKAPSAPARPGPASSTPAASAPAAASSAPTPAPAPDALDERAELAPTPPGTPRPTPRAHRESSAHPAARATSAASPAPAAVAAAPVAAARLLPGVLVTAPELCAMASIGLEQLSQLLEFGVVTRHKGSELFGDDAVEIAATAGAFIRAGIDARHLRAWRTSVEREIGLYEQLITPLLRQRHGQGREQAGEQLSQLQQLGAKFRAALARSITNDQIGI